MKNILEIIALVASISMPLFNIPLVVRIIKRKSAGDVSMLWVYGVYGCIVAMVPHAFFCEGIVLKAFSISNFILFSMVVIAVSYYRFFYKNPEVQ